MYLNGYYIDYERCCDGVVLYGLYEPVHWFDGSIKKRSLFNPIRISTINDCLTLPSCFQGMPVVGIVDFCMMGGNPYHLGERIEVKHLVIPASYRKLGRKNFSGWKNLEKVTLYCDERAMDEYNFAYCDNLVKVECMNSSIYSFCKSLPLKSYGSGYGCFDQCLECVDFVYVG